MSPDWLPHWGKPKDKASSEPVVEPALETSVPAEEDTQGIDPVDAGEAGGILAMPVSADLIMEALKEVEDPELGISIVELGLIYGIEIDDGKVRVRMTLTSPGCPIGPMLQAAVHGTVLRVYPQAEDVKVDLVWNPPWDPYKMASEEAKDMLGIW